MAKLDYVQGYEVFKELMPDVKLFDEDKLLGYSALKDLGFGCKLLDLGMTDSHFLNKYYKNAFDGLIQVRKDIREAMKITSSKEHREFLNFSYLMVQTYLVDAFKTYRWYDKRLKVLRNKAQYLKRNKEG